MENNALNDSHVNFEPVDVPVKRSSSSKKEGDGILRKSRSGKKVPEPPRTLTGTVDSNANISLGDNNSLSDGSFKDCIIIGKDGIATNNGQVVLGSTAHPVLSTHTVGKNGNANATPSAPEEYLIININGHLRKIALYNI